MYGVWDLFDLGMGQGMQESAPTHPFRALRWISACSRKAWVRMLTTDAGGGSPRVCRCRALYVVSIRLSSDCILASNSASLSLVAGTLSIRGGFARKMFLFRFFVLICSNGDDPGGVCFKFHRRPGFSAEATAIYIKGLAQFLPRTAAVKLFGQLVLALEGYDAIQTAVCAYIVVPVVNE